MTIANVGDINIEYYVEGSGPPLLMIMGTGGQAASWGEPLLTDLRKHFKVIRFSNRGTGLSSKPDTELSIRTMADDVAGLLSELRLERTHVLGVSPGGRIAQELTLSYPNKVQGLVLGCTNCGGPRSVGHAETMAKVEQGTTLPEKERIRRSLLLTVTPEFMVSGKVFLDGMIARRMAMPTPTETITRQLAASLAFDSYDRLPQIRAPTLIIHGDKDALTPVENAEVLHQRIPGSRVRIIQDTGHCFFWEKPEEVVEEIVGFLSRVPVGA